MSPTDTWVQHAAQQMGGSGWAVASIFFGVCLVIAAAICFIGAWREVKRGDEALQRQLERSEQRAKAGRHERT